MKRLIAVTIFMAAGFSAFAQYNPPTVSAPSSIIQGWPAGTSVGQTLVWNGVNWVPGSSSGGGATNGFPMTADGNGAGFSLTNLNNLSVTGSVSAVNFNVANLTLTNASGGVLSPSSNQTNYLIQLLAFPNQNVIHTANTNAYLTFQNTNQLLYQSTVIFNALTSSVNCQVSINMPAHSLATNDLLSFTVTNGTIVAWNFDNLNTQGTNLYINATYQGHKN